jgi:lycopene beta-cyclase
MGLTLAVGPATRPHSLNDENIVVSKGPYLADYDLIILGGGCAGLSLALRLAKLQAQCPRTLIMERRPAYSNDRTWCFWGDISEPVRHLVGHAWKTIQLRHGPRSVTVDCRASPYRMISGDTFYRAALQAIAENPRINLMLGTPPLAQPIQVRNKWQVEMEWEGREIRCQSAAIVDTRPTQTLPPQASLLWQSFTGHEIECETARFDPSSAELMNFTGPSNDGISFNYVLPLTPSRVLVEATVFGPTPAGLKQLNASLALATQRLMNGASYTVIRSENGVLPMGLRQPHNQLADITYIRAGLTAGAARPSTGYAFQRIQRWADACCLALSKGAPPLPHAPDPRLLRGLDSLFLSVLRSHPESAPGLFLDLFEKTPTASMVRFLSDRGTWRDYCHVAAALPAGPFLREIPKAIFRP